MTHKEEEEEEKEEKKEEEEVEEEPNLKSSNPTHVWWGTRRLQYRSFGVGTVKQISTSVSYSSCSNRFFRIKPRTRHNLRTSSMPSI